MICFLLILVYVLFFSVNNALFQVNQDQFQLFKFQKYSDAQVATTITDYLINSSNFFHF